jgi:RNA-directed DNA polymerase
MMHGRGKSDSAIVALKPANKAERSAAELGERRAGTKGNADQQSTGRAQNRATVTQALERIRQTARQRKKERFTALFHHISVDLLRKAFFALKQDAAPGTDGRIWQDYAADYGEDLELRLKDSTPGSNGERTGHCRRGGSTYPNRTDGNARLRSQPWRTRSSNGRRPRC